MNKFADFRRFQGIKLVRRTHISILKEAEDFNDIIIGDFYDTYENLPLKTYLGYQFYHDQCKVSHKP